MTKNYLLICYSNYYNQNELFQLLSYLMYKSNNVNIIE